MGLRQTEQAVIDLIINGQQAKTSLNEVSSAYTALRREIAAMKKEDDPALYKEKQNQLKALKAAQVELRKEQEAGIVSLVINGEKAKTSLREVTGAYNALNAEVARMRKEDDPALYEKKIAQLGQLKDAQAAMRKEVMGGTEAQKDFFSDWKKGFEEVEQLAEKVTLGTIVSKGVSGAIDFVKDFFASSQKEFEEAEKTQAQLQQVLKSTGGSAGVTQKQLEKYQQTLMAQTGIDDDVIAKGEEMLLTFTNVGSKIYEKALPAIVDMTSAMNQGNVSMETIQGTSIQVGKALNDPINGMASLRKVGVTFNDQQKEQIKTMQESGNLMGAQTIILQELQKEFGGTAEAIRNTSSGALMAFDTAMGNLKERVGGVMVAVKGFFAQALTPLVTWLGDTSSKTDLLTEAFNKQKNSIANLEKNTVPLLSRYDDLTSKGRLNKKEQSDLKDVIAQIAKDMPDAVTQWDKLGNAMGINTVKARENLQIQKLLLQESNKKAIEANKEDLAELQRQQQATQTYLNGNTVIKNGHAEFASGADKAEMAARLKDLAEQIKNKQLLLKGLNGEVIDTAGKINNGGDKDFKKLSDMTLGELKKRLSELQATLETTKIGGDEYIATVKKITEVEKLLNQEKQDTNIHAGESAAKKAAAEQKKLLTEFESLSAKHKALGLVELSEQMSANDKQVAAEEKKYDDLINANKKYLLQKNLTPAERKGTTAAIGDLETEKSEAVNNLRIRQEQELTDKIKNLRLNLAGFQETEYQKQVDQINKFYDEQQKAAGTNQEQLATIALSRQQDLSNAEIAEKQRLEDEKQKIEAEGDTLTGDRNDQRLAVINKRYDDEIAALKKKFSVELQATQEYQDAVDEINANRDQAIDDSDADADKKDRDKIAEDVKKYSDQAFSIFAKARKAETNHKISELEKQKEAELSNTNLTEAQKKSINDKYTKLENEEKTRAFKADQRAAVAQAVINTAVAVTKALPNLILAAIAGIAGAAEIATIVTEKPPTYAGGGLIPSGPSHEQGGINLVNNQTGESIAEMEGGEPIMILSKETQRNNGQLIKQLLFNSMYRNGASVNTEGISKGIQLARFGAVVSTTASGNTSSGGNQISTPAQNQSRMEELMMQMIEAQKQANDKEVVFNDRVYENYTAKKTQIRRNANA